MIDLFTTRDNRKCRLFCRLPDRHLPPQVPLSFPICFSADSNHSAGYPQAKSRLGQPHPRCVGMGDAVFVYQLSGVVSSTSYIPSSRSQPPHTESWSHFASALSSVHINLWLLRGWMRRKNNVWHLFDRSYSIIGNLLPGWPIRQSGSFFSKWSLARRAQIMLANIHNILEYLLHFQSSGLMLISLKAHFSLSATYSSKTGVFQCHVGEILESILTLF